MFEFYVLTTSLNNGCRSPWRRPNHTKYLTIQIPCCGNCSVCWCLLWKRPKHTVNTVEKICKDTEKWTTPRMNPQVSLSALFLQWNMREDSGAAGPDEPCSLKNIFYRPALKCSELNNIPSPQFVSTIRDVICWYCFRFIYTSIGLVSLSPTRHSLYQYHFNVNLGCFFPPSQFDIMAKLNSGYEKPQPMFKHFINVSIRQGYSYVNAFLFTSTSPFCYIKTYCTSSILKESDELCIHLSCNATCQTAVG